MVNVIQLWTVVLTGRNLIFCVIDIAVRSCVSRNVDLQYTNYRDTCSSFSVTNDFVGFSLTVTWTCRFEENILFFVTMRCFISSEKNAATHKEVGIYGSKSNT